jgi:sugar transferase (PEP-CTERM system associated)
MIRVLNSYHPSRTLLLVGYEILLIAVSFGVAVLWRWDPAALSALAAPAGLLQLLLTTGTYLVCLYYLDSYDVRTITNRSELIWRLFWVLGFASMAIAGIEYFFPKLIVVRDIYVLAIVISMALLLTARIAFSKMLQSPAERAILVGMSDLGRCLAHDFQTRPDLGIDLLGYLDDGQQHTNPNPRLKCLGSAFELKDVVQRTHATTIVVASQDRRGRLPIDDLLSLRLGGMKIYEAGTLCEQIVGKLPVENVLPSWLVFSEGFALRYKLILVQRLYSMLFAALGLVFLFPVMALTAIAIKLNSRGPVFYSQERVGLNQSIFTLYKFRSMYRDAEQKSGPAWATDKDQRVTSVGALLRKSHLDELPQLWNVLRGEMNLVGPRPERPGFVKVLETASPFYNYRHLVRPGITGWQQVSTGYCSTVEEQLERLRFDLFYIKHISLSLDLFILFKTGRIVVWGRGAR